MTDNCIGHLLFYGERDPAAEYEEGSDKIQAASRKGKVATAKIIRIECCSIL
jgi:hypothetical protein